MPELVSGPGITLTPDAGTLQVGSTLVARDIGVQPAGVSVPLDHSVQFFGDPGGGTLVYGRKNVVGGEGSSPINTIRAEYIGAEHLGSGLVTAMYGSHTYAWIKSTGNVSDIRVVEAHLRADGGGDVTGTANYFNTGGITIGGGSTFAQVAGYNCGDMGNAAVDRAYCFNATDGTLAATEYVAFRSQLVADPKKWAFFGAGTAQSAFGGKVRIGGTSAPVKELDVTGHIGATGEITSSGFRIGYNAGAGGTATQATSKTTGVTVNKPSGQITLNGAALASNASASFTLTNSIISSLDVVVANIASSATADAYVITVTAVSTGSCRIQVRNVSGGSLSEALVINFAVFKGSSA
jgi:hypothetical protein